MKKILHIGMQKCASTSFQNLMLDEEDVYFLGKDMNFKKFNKFLDDDIGKAIQWEILSSSQSSYAESFVKEVFDINLKKAKDKNANYFVLSDENFCNSGSYIESETSIKRAINAMGEDTEVVIIIRNQWKLMESTYKNAVKLGFPHTYQYFCEYTLLHKNQRLMSYLMYNSFIKSIANITSRIHIWKFEDVVSKGFHNDLFNNIDFSKMPLDNKSPDEDKLEIIRRLNGKKAFFAGGKIYDVINNATRFSLNQGENLLTNYPLISKRQSGMIKEKKSCLKKARHIGWLRKLCMLGMPTLDFSISAELKKEMNDVFVKENRELSKNFSLDLRSYPGFEKNES